MDVENELVDVLPFDSFFMLWDSLDNTSRAAVRSTCRSLRERIDSRLIKTVSLDLAETPSLSHFVNFVPKLGNKTLQLRLKAKPNRHLGFPDIDTEKLRQLLEFRHQLRPFQQLTLLCDQEPNSQDTVLDSSLVPLITCNLPTLSILDLQNCSISTADLHTLSASTSLRQLTTSVHLDSPGLATAPLLPPQLTHLQIPMLTTADPSWRLDLTCLQHLSQLKSLTLDLLSCDNISALGQLTTLTNLTTHCIDDAQHGFLQNLTQLRVLDINALGQLGLVALQSLHLLPNLTQLFLSSPPVTRGMTWQPGSPTMPALNHVCIGTGAHDSLGLHTLHWLLKTAPQLSFLQMFTKIVVPDPGDVAGGTAVVQKLLGEVAQLLQEVPLFDGHCIIHFGNVHPGHGSIAPYITALAPLSWCREKLVLQAATVDEQAVAALNTAWAEQEELQLLHCQLVDPRRCLPLLAKHPSLSTLSLTHCQGTQVAAGAVVALAALAPKMSINVTAFWWDDDHAGLVFDLQQQMIESGAGVEAEVPQQQEHA